MGSGSVAKVMLDDVKSLHIFVADSTPLYARAIIMPLATIVILFWLDWRLAEKNHGQLRFFQKLIRLRRDHSIFRRAEFFEISSPDRPPSSQEIIWHGQEPGHPDWSPQSRTLAFLLKDLVPHDGTDSNFYVMLNGQPDQPAFFTVPDTSTGARRSVWKKILDTDLASPDDFRDLSDAPKVAVGAAQPVAAMGCVVLQSEERKSARRKHK